MRNGVFENTSAAMDAANEGVDQELPNEGPGSESQAGASNEQFSNEILSLGTSVEDIYITKEGT